MKKLMLLLLTVLVFGACKESEEPLQDAFVFGRWSAFCTGNCIQIYKLENDKLYVDNLNSFREAATITYKPTPLSNQYVAKAKSLRDSFPQSLLENPFSVIGCPDCADQGGIYLAFDNREGTLYWQIDADETTWPEVIRPYLEELTEFIDQLPQD
jgi:hypothetical protein